MKSIVTVLCTSLAVVAMSATGCGSTAKDTRDLGDVTVGAYTVHLETEGAAVSPGAVTQFVVKPTAGGKPTSVVGWVGVQTGEGSTKAPGNYDANDGDYDIDVTAPNPIPTGSMFWFQLETNGHIDTGSIAY